MNVIFLRTLEVSKYFISTLRVLLGKQTLLDICDELRPDFLCISESWLKTCHSDNEFRINTYKLFRKDKDSTLGGGVAVYAKMDSNFKFNEIRDESSVEKVIINVSQMGTKDFIIASIYQPPDSELTYDLEINRILKKFSH